MGIESGKPTQPDFRNALQTQRVCDAVLEAARSGKWMETGVELKPTGERAAGL
jgi:predicted dehydrogenase